ncbi:MAG: conjugal transfer protein TraJ [Rhodocyclaceae bacterium]
MADDDTTPAAGRPRRKVPPIKVWVTDAEKAEVADRAAQAGLSLSAYMLAAGLNHPIRSVYDLKAVADLGRVNGDLGRVAGLLKLWLAEKRGQGARPIDVEKMMSDFRILQDELTRVMGRALKQLLQPIVGIGFCSNLYSGVDNPKPEVGHV